MVNPSTDARRQLVVAQADERVEALQVTVANLVTNEPLTLEIGCGHGHFLTSYAQAHPHLRCVGIDVSRDRIARATRKRNRLVNNLLTFLIADAHEFFRSLPDQAAFREIYVLFPDPWPKRRHHKNRLIQADFLRTLAQRSTPRARFYFRSDFGPYCDWTARIIADSPDWQLVEADWPFESETVFQARALSYRSLIAERR